MSHGQEILSAIVKMSRVLGSVEADIRHMKSDIASLKNKKPWIGKINWAKLGKGIGYIVLSIALAGGGAAGLSNWLGLFK